MIIKGYKYRLCPNNEQKILLEKHFGASRWIYNYGLKRKIESYQKDKQKISCFDLMKDLPKLKKEKETEWLNEINAQSLCMSIRNLDNAFTKFFREKKGFPNFKSKKSKNSFSIAQGNKIDFIKGKSSFIKLGKINVVVDREFKGRIVKATISKNSINQYFVSYTVETSANPIEPQKIKNKTSIGIDLGIKTFATISNGVKIDNPKFLSKSEKRLAVLQRRLSKKKKSSNNRVNAKYQVAKLHTKISNQRLNFLHNLTYQLTHDNQVETIAIEDLNVAGMVKNHCLAKSISDVSWYEFKRQLEYKSKWYGKNLLVVGRFEPSSKMCSCGEINQELTLKDREWNCKKCGLTHDRDLLASQNIKRFALQKQNLI